MKKKTLEQRVAEFENKETFAVNYLAKKLEKAESSLKIYRDSFGYWENLALKGKQPSEVEKMIETAMRGGFYA